LLNLGLDAIRFESADAQSPISNPPIIALSGRAPNLTIGFKDATSLLAGQREAYYWLLEHELDDDTHTGSIFTLGEAARLGYLSANLAMEAIYHAGRGGAGAVFARFASALVLRGEPLEGAEFFASVSPAPPAGEGPRLVLSVAEGVGAFARNLNAATALLIDTHCARLSGKTGGTIAKLYATGADPDGRNSLPAQNARQMGYALADLGGPQVLKATRRGQTGCHWCHTDFPQSLLGLANWQVFLMALPARVPQGIGSCARFRGKSASYGALEPPKCLHLFGILASYYTSREIGVSGRLSPLSLGPRRLRPRWPRHAARRL
jgi:hypothetical protein